MAATLENEERVKIRRGEVKEIVLWNGDSFHTSHHRLSIRGTPLAMLDTFDLVSRLFDDCDYEYFKRPLE